MLHDIPFYAAETADDRARLLIARCIAACTANQRRSYQAQDYASLYEGLNLSSLSLFGYEGARRASAVGGVPTVIKNEVRSIVNSWVAKVAANDAPLPQFMGSGGNWDTRIRTRRLDQAIEAELLQAQAPYQDAHALVHQAVRIAVGCTGSFAIFAEAGYGKVCYTLDDTLTMGVDRDGETPFALVRTVTRDPYCLADKYPTLSDRIMAAVEDIEDSVLEINQEQTYRRRVVRVYQGWCVKRGETDGMFVECIRTPTGPVVLRDEAYEEYHFPCVIWHFERELKGSWGVPLTHTLFELALTQNQVLKDLVADQHEQPKRIVEYEADSLSDKTQISESRSTMFVERQSGASALQVHNPPTYNRDDLALVEYFSESLYQISGVSRAHAEGARQPGTTSGRHEKLVALLFSERFAVQERELVKARTVELARVSIAPMRQIIEDGTFKERRLPKKSRLVVIRPEDIDLDGDWHISVAPVSEYKNSPQSRLEKAREYFEQGWLDAGQYIETEKDLNITAETALTDAQLEWIDELIERWLYEPLPSDTESDEELDFYQSPDYWLDVVVLAKRVSTAYTRARLEGAPAKRLSYLKRFMQECRAIHEQHRAQEQAAVATKAPMGEVFPGAANPMVEAAQSQEIPQ
jgi:hypothetical protein